MTHQTNPIPVSTSGQLKAFREHVENNDYVVVREYVDEAKSAATSRVTSISEPSEDSDLPADSLVKRMFDMAEFGSSLIEIAKALNDEGFTTARRYR